MSTFLTFLSERLQTGMNPADILSKLSSLDKQVMDNRNTSSTCFGLEDSDGNIIKVYVDSEQAKEFDQALSMALDSQNEQDDQEIAEILYKLHDQFDITDVQWPSIEEDEEGDETGASDFEQPTNADTPPNGEQPVNNAPMGSDDTGMTGGDSATGALDSVLQAMIANAEADRQEALAKAAEARAREAEAAAKLADQKLKSEEEVADMEAYYDAQNDEKKEAKKLAKLAKYRHTIKQREDGTGPFNGPGEALDAQKRDSEQRMDMPSGVNPEGTDPSEPVSQDDNSDIQPEMQDVGFENEEKRIKRIEAGNRFKSLRTAVQYLHSLNVRRAVHND